MGDREMKPKDAPYCGRCGAESAWLYGKVPKEPKIGPQVLGLLAEAETALLKSHPDLADRINSLLNEVQARQE